MSYETNGSGTASTSSTYMATNSAHYLTVTSALDYRNDNISVGATEIKDQHGIHPMLYFKYIKKNFGIIERAKLDRRLKMLENACNKAMESGQVRLSEKIFADMVRSARESAMYAKGIKHFVEHNVLNKYKYNIRGGHISDTMFKEFTRVIPEKVLKRKKEVECVFDDFVIYHYYNPNAESTKKMSRAEKFKMEDPVLFGIITETDRLYYIADWVDEFCDLSFDEMVSKIGKKRVQKFNGRTIDINLKGEKNGKCKKN